MSEEHESKRRKLTESRYVFLSTFDFPNMLVESDVHLLETMDCRLYHSIKNTEPTVFKNEIPVFRTGHSMTRPMLLTFLKSSAYGELVLSDGCSVGDALRMFDYEGVSLSGRSTLKKTAAGVAFKKYDVDVTIKMCQMVSDSILRWPRLEVAMSPSHVLISARDQQNLLENVTTTPTRAWVKFMQRPETSLVNSDEQASLNAKRNPLWLRACLVTLGRLRYKLSEEDQSFDRTSHTKESFNKLKDRVGNANSFFMHLVDSDYVLVPDFESVEMSDALTFAREITNAAAKGEGGQEMVCFSNDVIKLVTFLHGRIPSFSRLFSGAVADTEGNTPERSGLKRALAARNVSIIRWSDRGEQGVKPVRLPHFWPDTGGWLPSVLLSFENVHNS